MNFVKKAMENLKVELAAGQLSLAEMKIQRRIFREESFSLLLFKLEMLPHYGVLMKSRGGY